MNVLIHFNDYMMHAPVGVVAMVFSIILGYILKTAEFFPNKFIPAIVVPVTAVLFALVQLCSDILSGNANAGLYLLLNFIIGFGLGGFAWLAHAQVLKRFIDPKLFNDDGSTKFLKRDAVSNPQPPNQQP